MAKDPWARQMAPVRTLPGPVRTVRLTLLVLAAFTALVVIGGLLVFDITPEFVGALIWTALPGIAGLVLALRIPRGGTRAMFWLVIAIAVLTLVGALETLSTGSARGFTQLVLPIVLLAAVTRPAARRYFSNDAADDAYSY